MPSCSAGVRSSRALCQVPTLPPTTDAVMVQAMVSAREAPKPMQAYRIQRNVSAAMMASVLAYPR